MAKKMLRLLSDEAVSGAGARILDAVRPSDDDLLNY